MRRVRGQRTMDSFKRLLLCTFSRTGRSFGRICEVLPNKYTPRWIGARIGPHGHGSLLGDDVWYAVYWDYSDLPSDTWKQTARSLWLAMLSERGETPTTADQNKFDVFVICLQDAPAWREQKKLEKAGRESQKEASADAHALGLGMCTPHCLSFQIAYAQRFATCTPCKYKKSGVRHRHTPCATDATELAPVIGDWKGHLDEPCCRHVAQNEKDENQDSDTSSVIIVNPLAQPETLTQPQRLTQPQTFSARAPRTQDLPPDHAEEETIKAYPERLLGSALRRNSLTRRPGDTPSEDADFAEAQTAKFA